MGVGVDICTVLSMVPGCLSVGSLIKWRGVGSTEWRVRAQSSGEAEAFSGVDITWALLMGKQGSSLRQGLLFGAYRHPTGKGWAGEGACTAGPEKEAGRSSRVEALAVENEVACVS